MKLERRDDDRWHVAATKCGQGDTVHDSVEVDPDDGFAREDGELVLRHPEANGQQWCADCQDIVADRYAQASDAIEHWKVTTPYRDVEWSEYGGGLDRCSWCRSEVDVIVTDGRTDTLVCVVCAALYNSSATDAGDAVTLTDCVRLADAVEPVVVFDGDANQRSAAKIDRRPYVSIDAKRKYVAVTITLKPTHYQFSEDALASLREVFETYEARAARQPDNKGGVEFDVAASTSGRDRRPRQRITVDGLFEDDARAFVEDALPVVRETANWTYDPSTVSDQATRRAIWDHGRPGPAPVPREGAPAVTVQDDGLARHVSLADKSITDAQIRSYVSDQAYRHGEALVDAGRLRVDHTDGHNGDADGYDVQSGIGFDLWFENGEIVDHECFCDSSLDPCEHVAGGLIALPYVAACYV